MKYCDECGAEIKSGAKFCTSCGKKIKTSSIKKSEHSKKEQNKIQQDKPKKRQAKTNTNYTAINKKLEIENNQSKVVSRSWYAVAFFALIIISAVMEIISIHPAAFFLSIFFMLCAIVIALMFKSREKKLQTLISGENLLAQWTLSPEQKDKFIDYQFQQRAGMNIFILLVIGVIAAVIFGLFIIAIDDGKLFMFFIFLGLMAFLSIFAFGTPYYYKFTNNRGDGRILIGAKYVYINGYFHNWDFIMSGLKKIKAIKEPFYGIYLVYYYTDRTYQHSEELYIPANEDVDLNFLITQLKQLNKK